MKLFIGALLVLPAVFLTAAGVAALTRGRVLPTSRRAVRSPRRYGWGQLIVAVALCWQAVFLLLVDDIATRQWGTLSGSALLLAGVLVAFTGTRRTQNGAGDVRAAQR
ncbi:hypothetical protein H7827_03500 [Streptomyces sp. JH002]|jgi:hypothetical protein|uniref:hypothetical protein n=1 Tax=Streptomyces TaxID=1883 RepID=UPI001F466500|nr:MULTISPECIES: hypothetical protein [unclassified Streptomyces]MCU4746265.1 hypothetical protein [Streptomyces sp. G-5]